MWHFYDNSVYPISMGKEKAETEARRTIDSHNGKHNSNLEYKGLLKKSDHYRIICVDRATHNTNKQKHQTLSNYAKSQGINIYNIVPDGFESPIYEKKNWEQVEHEIFSY
mgnify:CR=1 FL=1